MPFPVAAARKQPGSYELVNSMASSVCREQHGNWYQPACVHQERPGKPGAPVLPVMTARAAFSSSEKAALAACAEFRIVNDEGKPSPPWPAAHS
jgi:hypothetical protein